MSQADGKIVVCLGYPAVTSDEHVARLPVTWPAVIEDPRNFGAPRHRVGAPWVLSRRMACFRRPHPPTPKPPGVVFSRFR